MIPLVYLGCPYTSPELSVRQERAELASLAAARCMQNGYVVFSPITHGHQVADHLPASVAGNHRFWMQQCLPLLRVCDALVILPLDGWRDSRGLFEEICCAEAAMIPIYIISSFSPTFDHLLARVPEDELRRKNWQRCELSLTFPDIPLPPADEEKAAPVRQRLGIDEWKRANGFA